MGEPFPGPCTPLSLWFLALDTGCPTLGSKCIAQNIKGGMFFLNWVGDSGERETVSFPGERPQCYPEAPASPGLCDKVREA